ncbi:hypothetical protein CYMTET_24111, partial [Cymbomonas tetramitiformis]
STTPDTAARDVSTIPDTATGDVSTTPDTAASDDSTTPDTAASDVSTAPDTVTIDDITTPDTAASDDSTTPDTAASDVSTAPDTVAIDDSTTPDTATGDVSTAPDTVAIDDGITPDTAASDVSTTPDTAASDVSTALDTATGDVSTAPGPVGDVSTTPETAIGDVSTTLDTATGDVSTAPDTATGDISTMPDTVAGSVSTMPETAIGGVSTAPDTATGDISTTPGHCCEVAGTAPDAATGDVSTTPDTVAGDVSTMPDTAIGDVSTMPDTATGDVSTTPDTAAGDVSTTPDTVASDVSITPETVASDVSTTPDTNKSGHRIAIIAKDAVGDVSTAPETATAGDINAAAKVKLPVEADSGLRLVDYASLRKLTSTPTSFPEHKGCAAESSLNFSTAGEVCLPGKVDCSLVELKIPKAEIEEVGAVEFCDTDFAQQFVRNNGCIFVQNGTFHFAAECALMQVPKFSCADALQQCLYSGNWTSWDVWRPAEPSYHIFSRPEAFQLLKKRRLAFVGDSLMRQQFNHQLQYLRGNTAYADVPQMGELLYQVLAAEEGSVSTGASVFTDIFQIKDKGRLNPGMLEFMPVERSEAHLQMSLQFRHTWRDVPDLFNQSNMELEEFDPDAIVLHLGAWLNAKEDCATACLPEQQSFFKTIKQYMAEHPTTKKLLLIGAPDQLEHQQNIVEMNEYSRMFCEENPRIAQYVDFYNLTRSPNYVWSKGEDDVHFGCGFADAGTFHIAKIWKKGLGPRCEDVVNANLMQMVFNHLSHIFVDDM